MSARDRRMAAAMLSLAVVAGVVQVVCVVALFVLLPWPWALAILLFSWWSTRPRRRAS